MDPRNKAARRVPINEGMFLKETEYRKENNLNCSKRKKEIHKSGYHKALGISMWSGKRIRRTVKNS